MVKLLEEMGAFGKHALKFGLLVPELLLALSGDVKAQTTDKDPIPIECCIQSEYKEIKISDKEIKDFLDKHHLSINDNILLHMFNNPEEYKDAMNKICSSFPKREKLKFPVGFVTLIDEQGGTRIILETKEGEHFTFAWNGDNCYFPYINYVPYKCNQNCYNDLIIGLFISVDDQSQKVKGDNSTVNELLNTARDQSEDEKKASLGEKMQDIIWKSGKSIGDTVIPGGTHPNKKLYFDVLKAGNPQKGYWRNGLRRTAKSNP